MVLNSLNYISENKGWMKYLLLNNYNKKVMTKSLAQSWSQWYKNLFLRQWRRWKKSL